MSVLPFYSKQFTSKLTPAQFKVKLWKVTVDWSYMPVHGTDYTYTFFKEVDFNKVIRTYVEAKINENCFRLRVQQPFYWKQILSIQMIGKYSLVEGSEETAVKVYARPNFFFIGLTALTLAILLLTGNSLIYILIPIAIYCIIFNLEIRKLDKCLREVLSKN